MITAPPERRTALDRFMDALESRGCKRGRRNGRGYMIQCPAHADRTPSLSVEQKDNRVLVKCFGGCTTEDVVAAVGLTMAHLFDKPREGIERNASRRRSTPPRPKSRDTGKPQQSPAESSTRPQRVVATYSYPDRHGETLRLKQRLEPGAHGHEKDFVWTYPDGQPCMRDGNPGVLYNLPALVEAEHVHINEGEKACDALMKVLPLGHAATCLPAGDTFDEDALAALRGKSVTLWVDRDEPGIKKAQKRYAQLREEGVHVQAVRSRTTGEHDDAFDHVEAGHPPIDGERVPDDELLNEEQRQQDALAERFSAEASSIEFVFDLPPRSRDFLVTDFLPERETGLLIARGGTGKGFLQLDLALAIVLGEPFGPFTVPRARGVVLVSAEEDRDEIHRRLHAAIEARVADEIGTAREDWRHTLREAVVRHLRFVSVRGLTGAHLGPALREQILRTAALTESHALTCIDPLGRFVPQGITINSQEGAGFIVNELDAVAHETSASVLAAYHVSKAAMRADGELQGGASSGSQQLEDLSRWVLNLASLKPTEAEGYNLDAKHRYVEAAVTKTNYTPPLSEPLVFTRGTGGALIHVKTRSKADTADEVALTALLKANDWLDGDEWEQQARKVEGFARDAFRAARGRLEREAKVECIELRRSRSYRKLFAPTEQIRPTTWPATPATLADFLASRKDENEA